MGTQVKFIARNGATTNNKWDVSHLKFSNDSYSLL